jgi:hypothetical protein
VFATKTLDAAVNAARAIVDKAEAERRSLTAEERAEAKRLIGQADDARDLQIEDEIERMQAGAWASGNASAPSALLSESHHVV